MKMDRVLTGEDAPQLGEVLRTIREPMREWWLRVLRWWAVPLVLWLAWSLWQGVWYYPRAIELNWPEQSELAIMLINNVINLAFQPAALILWSLAAWKANQLISSAHEGGGRLDLSSSKLLPARFIAGLQQGWLPLAIVLTGSIISGVASGLFYPSADLNFSLWQLNLYQAALSPFFLLAIMIWQCAICAVANRQPWAWWIWTVALVLAGEMAGILQTIAYMTSDPFQTLQPREPVMHGWAWAVGLAVMITLIEALRAKWKWLKYSVFTVVLASVLITKLAVPSWWIWWTKFGETGIDISDGLVMFTPWMRLFSFNPIGAIPGGITGLVDPPGWLLVTTSPVAQIPGHPAWVIPAVLIGNLLWYALLTALLYYLSLRPDSDPAD